MKRKKTIVAGATVAVLVCTGGVAMTTVAGLEDKRSTAVTRTDLPAATAAVERGDLTRRSRVDGTLGFSAERKPSYGSQGILTWLPEPGTTLRRDGRLYDLNGVSVRLWYGDTPMYRKLQRGFRGADVRQVKKNLIALGLGSGLAADDVYTPGTERAVRAWQERHGLEETGVLSPRQVAFMPGAVRTQESETFVGTMLTPGAEMYTVTGTGREVEFDTGVEDAADLKKGNRVEVELPNGSSTGGRIARIGSTARSDAEKPDAPPTVKVTVELDDAQRVQGLDQAPVTVHLEGETRRDALHVPVGALLAGPRGTFLLEVVANGQVDRIEVEPGLFADDRVEVTGAGLRAGMRVGVPKS